MKRSLLNTKLLRKNFKKLIMLELPFVSIIPLLSHFIYVSLSISRSFLNVDEKKQSTATALLKKAENNLIS